MTLCMRMHVYVYRCRLGACSLYFVRAIRLLHINDVCCYGSVYAFIMCRCLCVFENIYAHAFPLAHKAKSIYSSIHAHTHTSALTEGTNNVTGVRRKCVACIHLPNYSKRFTYYLYDHIRTNFDCSIRNSSIFFASIKPK